MVLLFLDLQIRSGVDLFLANGTDLFLHGSGPATMTSMDVLLMKTPFFASMSGSDHRTDRSIGNLFKMIGERLIYDVLLHTS